MKKSTLLKIVNPILVLIFLIQASTGIFHDLIPFPVFHFLHPVAGYVLALLVAIHFTLNWNWVKTLFVKNRKNK